MIEPRVRFKHDDGTDYPQWSSVRLSELLYRVNERNNGQFDNTKWISVARMYYQEPEKVQSNNIDTRTYVMRYGDIAFEGHPNEDYKYGRFVLNDIGDGVISELFPIYRFKQEHVLEYWKYAIQIEKIMAPIYRKAITLSGASSNKLNEEDFLRESILVPCIEEQRKIADFLSAVDEVITVSEEEVANLETQKKAVMKKIFSQEVRFKKEDGSDFPEWEEKSLSELAYLRGRIGFRGYTRDDLVSKEDGVISLSPSNIIDGFASYNSNTYISLFKYDESPEIKVAENDILFTKTGSTVGKIGFVKELPEPATINPQIALITVNGCNPYYLCLAMQNDNNVDFVRGITVGGAIPTLSQEELKKMLIPLPCREEQRLIADFLSDFDEAIAAAKKELELWKELKKGLLQQMFV